MNRPAGTASLTGLMPDELSALRLAAQVMSHRALSAGTSAAALYFDSLATAVDAEEAARAQTGSDAVTGAAQGRQAIAAPLLLQGAHGEDDRRVVGECLALLAANDRLPPGVREVCRALEIPFRQ